MAVSIIAVVLAFLGILLPFWGFVMIGILIAVVRGNWQLALCLSVCADLLYGTPTGILSHTLMPFTLLSVFILSLRFVLMSQMREQETFTL